MSNIRPEDEMSIALWNGWLRWLGREPTDEELCHQIRTSKTCHRFAWDMFIAKNPSVDHFIKISQQTFRYQEQSFFRIVVHARNKHDLLFVMSRTWNHLLMACKRLTHTYEVTSNELEQAFRRLTPPDAVALTHHILNGPINRNCAVLYAIKESLPDECRALISQFEKSAFERIMCSTHGNVRVKAANRFIRAFPSKSNTLRVFALFGNERTAPWLQTIGQDYVADNKAVNWIKLCAFIPDKMSQELYEALDILVRIDGTKRPLTFLLKRTFGGRKLAATHYLTYRNLSAGELCLLVRYAPKRQRAIAAIRLLNYKAAHIQHLARIWNRVEFLRKDVEKRILKQPLNEKRVQEILRYSPPLLKELRRQLAIKKADKKSNK